MKDIRIEEVVNGWVVTSYEPFKKQICETSIEALDIVAGLLSATVPS